MYNSIPTPKNNTTIYLPSIFDANIQRKLGRYAEHAKLFLNILVNKHLQKTNKPWFRLKTQYLMRTVHHDFPVIRNALLANGMIVFDPHYQQGSHCRRYGLSQACLDHGYCQEVVMKKTLIKRLLLTITHWNIHDEVLWAMNEWCKLLRLDYEAALLHLGMRHKKHGKRFHLKQLKLHDMRSGNVGVSSQDQQGRVYNGLTNLWSEFRQFLTINGELLVNVDITSSQPLFLHMLMQQQKEQTSPSHSSPLLYDCSLLETDIGSSSFGYMVASGKADLYSYIADQAAAIGLPQMTRPNVKPALFRVFYGRNKTQSKFKALFSDLFPKVAKFIHDQKIGNYKRLALLMQKKEADFLINTVCKRLCHDHPHIPFITIHDSIMTTASNAENVKRIMQDEFHALGVRPKIKLT
jgi:hypothetical protein